MDYAFYLNSLACMVSEDMHDFLFLLTPGFWKIGEFCDVIVRHSLYGMIHFLLYRMNYM